ncbi:MAG: hypothetical protein HY748_14770 [Elusimicrobia bacterium]|nr:hypothetical protein [Elusimicrobiota bacterium]
MAVAALVLLLGDASLLVSPAQAQEPSAAPPAPGPSAQAVSTTTPAAVFYATATAIPIDRGPWVLGEVILFSGDKVAAEPSWRDRVRGRRGMLYTKADISNDIDSLNSLKKFDQVESLLFEMPDTPVPEEYRSVSVSTNQVRLVYRLAVKPEPATKAPAEKSPTPPAAVSGIVLTPTAYRGAGRYTTPGMGLDFNACYFIGRLYGHNSFENSVRKTNYIDRLGVWMLSAEGKMQVQSEGRFRPAMAVGARGHLLLRDAPQPTVNTPTVSVKVSQETTRAVSDAYIAASKSIKGVRVTAGYMMGSTGDLPGQLTEFLAPQALEFYAGRKGDRTWSRSMPFASILYLPKPQYPLGVEFIKFNGASLNPMLVNFKLGYFFHLNFDVSYLRFNGGYDILGTFQFRYNHFPRR